MLPTPSTSHVPFERIYEPSEDSYLLLDTLSSPSEVAFLKHRFGQCAETANGAGRDGQSPLIVEVGTGSGVVLAFLTAHARAIFGRDDVLTLGTDVNSHACHASQKTVALAVVESTPSSMANGSPSAVPMAISPAKYLGSLLADLCAPLRHGVTNVLVFNPPYVPTPSLPSLPGSEAQIGSSSMPSAASTLEDDPHLLALSYAGGTNGMQTTERLLSQLDDILDKQRGVAYVLFCAQNKPEEVKKRIRDGGVGWAVETVGRSGKTAGWEKLEILRIWRQASELPAS